MSIVTIQFSIRCPLDVSALRPYVCSVHAGIIWSNVALVILMRSNLILHKMILAAVVVGR